MAGEPRGYARPPMGGGDMMPTGDGVGALQRVPEGSIVRRTGNAYSTAMAVTKPRRLAAIIEAAKDEAFQGGDIMYYAWGEGKDHIEGPSKQLAFAAVRLYGNAVLDMDEVQDLGDSWIMTARFVDLETGFTMTRQFRQSKNSVVYGKMEPERKMDIRFQNGQTRAARNVVLNAVPGALINAMMEAAKSSVRAEIEGRVGNEGLPRVRDLALSRLAQLGATDQARIFARLNVDNLSQVSIDHLVTLKGCVAAIERRETTVAECFPPIEDEKATPEKGGTAKAPEVPAKAAVDKPAVPTPPAEPPAPIAGPPSDNLLGEDLELPGTDPKPKKK